MSLEKWEEKMNDKKWDEMQKYKTFDKENFKGVEKFSNFFNKLFNFLRFSLLGICILAILVCAMIYLLFTSNLKHNYVESSDLVDLQIITAKKTEQNY